MRGGVEQQWKSAAVRQKAAQEVSSDVAENSEGQCVAPIRTSVLAWAHRSMHDTWNLCPHGSSLRSTPGSYSS